MTQELMPEADFWGLISLLEGSTDSGAVQRLTEQLRARGAEVVAAFQERLAAILYELDRQVLFEQPVRWTDQDPDEEPVPLSEDTFLYLRAGIVARGKDTVEAVLADSDLLTARAWDDGERLLVAAPDALGNDLETAVSYETGSNTEHWSASLADTVLSGPPAHGGVFVAMPCDLSEPIEAYRSDTDRELVVIGYQTPRWLPFDAWVPVKEVIGTIIYEAGGVPDSCGGTRIDLDMGFGNRWQLTPEPGQWGEMSNDQDAVHLRVEMPRAAVRKMSEPDQLALLVSVAATCALFVLPADHRAREQLAIKQAAGLHLIPATT